MKPATASVLALRPVSNVVACPTIRPLLLSRQYATHKGLGTTPSTGPRRRTVTAFNDDGFVPWNELSAGEKASRATQQTFNFGMVLAGIVLTVRLLIFSVLTRYNLSVYALWTAH
jgi:import inner membrane translocase subunit TIM21